MNDLEKALAAARESLTTTDEYADPPSLALKRLLAALDAQEPVATVNRHMLAKLGPDRWIPACAPEAELAPTDVALYLAPPAQREAEPDAALADTQRAIIEAAERRGCERGLKDAQPVAVPEVLVRAYFHRFSEVEDDYTIYHTLDGVCEQCIPVLIVRDDSLAAVNGGKP